MKKILKGVLIGIVVIAIIAFVLSKSGLFAGKTLSGAVINTEDDIQDTGHKENQEGTGTSDSKSLNEKKTEHNNLLLKVLELKQVSETDLIRKAELIVEIDDMTNILNNNPITDKWETTILCLADACTDTDFFNLILTIALEGDKTGLSYGNLIVNLLTANKYWNTDNVVKFSQAITSANNMINRLNDEAVTAKWHEIIDCDGGCAEKNKFNFEIIKLIVQ